MTYEMGSLPIILASNTGNTRTFIPFIQEYAKRDLQVIEDFNNPFPSCNSLAIGAYTWGNGKIPKRLKEYLIETIYSRMEEKFLYLGVVIQFILNSVGQLRE